MIGDLFAYVGLGANLGDSLGLVEEALLRLHQLGQVLRRSAYYRTAPWPTTAAVQPPYVNAAALLQVTDPAALSSTVLPSDRSIMPLNHLDVPQRLLGALLRIEAGLGRVRVSGNCNAPRLIDLDVLLLGPLGQQLVASPATVDLPALTVPHPRLHLRAFALRPLLDLNADLLHPVLRRPLADLYLETLRTQAAPCKLIG